MYKYLHTLNTAKASFLALILLISGGILYAPSLANGFAWDDFPQIVNNPLIASLSNILTFFQGSTFWNPTTQQAFGYFYRPLFSVVLSVEFTLWHTSPFGYHLFSILIHLANALLVFLLIRRLLLNQAVKYAQAVSFVSACLFLFHPITVESVAYISAIDTLMSTGLVLFSFILYLKYFSLHHKSFKQLMSASIILLLAFFTRESALTAVPLLLIYSYFFARAHLKKLAISLSAILAIYGFLRFIAHIASNAGSVSVPIQQAGLLSRILTLAYMLATYTKMLLYPIDLHIYRDEVIHTASDPRFLLSLFVVAIVVAGYILLLFRLKSKLLLFFTCWIGITLFPFLQIIPLDMTMAERWLYLPLVGIVASFGIVASQVRLEKLFQYIVFLCFVVICPFFAFVTIQRIGDWHDNTTLFRHDVTLEKESPNLYDNYGTILLQEGNTKGSQDYFEKAIHLAPSQMAFYNNLALSYVAEGNKTKARQIYLYIINHDNRYKTYEYIAEALLNTDTPQKVLSFIQKPLAQYPNNVKLNAIAGYAYQEMGKSDIAQQYFQKVMEFDPTYQLEPTAAH